ncbi:AAA family ATPase [Methylomonas sp. HYX-M1]|uniref:AAA family ATPase n=1 Tax=Methylomonas sp. HYX-M1 TaxID=3139307 RepID=UPI00345BED9B
MINSVELKNFGPIDDLSWSNLGRVNLVIGGNSAGKTCLLKSLYTAIRTLEEYKRGNEPRSASEILASKLYWTFQPDNRIGDLVSKNSDQPLDFKFTVDDKDFSYTFGKDTTKAIPRLENHVAPRGDSNSIFLPAKEVLSIHNIIIKSREQDNAYGFDDTYYDLAKALSQVPRKGGNSKEFSQSRKSLEDMFGGKVEYDQPSSRWQFKKDNQRFSIGVTAEGSKKIAILDTLLGNRYLSDRSIVFIDEPESALHPKAVSILLDIVSALASRGIQFFIASHSYFVVKKLFLIAQQQKISVPVLSNQEGWVQSDLLKDFPDNPIIDEATRLFKEEISLPA